MKHRKDVRKDQMMSDAPVTRQPVPRPRWNDYQAVQRATMNHSSSILQNAPSVSQTGSRPANQSVKRAGRSPSPSDSDSTCYTQLTKTEATQNTKLDPN